MEKRMFQAPKRLGNQIICHPFIPKIKNNLRAPIYWAWLVLVLSRKLWRYQGLTDPPERLEVALRECFYDLGNLPKEMVRQEMGWPVA
jgi:hypothetical protein